MNPHFNIHNPKIISVKMPKFLLFGRERRGAWGGGGAHGNVFENLFDRCLGGGARPSPNCI